MGGDVDLVKLMGAIRSSLPAPMAITTEAITITAVTATVATGTTSGLDTSGLPAIAAVNISGTGQALDNLATYVDNLQKLPGVVSVNPTTNVQGAHGVTFSLSWI